MGLLPLSAEVAAARAAARLSRLDRPRRRDDGARKAALRLDRRALERLAARLPQGAVLVSATNGKTTTAKMAAEILAPRFALAHNTSGANLVSGVASTLLEARGADLALLEVDEDALPGVAERVRPRALCLGNLFRDQLDRYGELEAIATRWRAAVAALPEDTVVVANADDPQVARAGARAAARARLRDRRPAQSLPSLPHAADSKWCLVCGTRVRVRRRLRRPPRRLPLPQLRPRAAAARRGGPARSSSTGSRASRSSSSAPAGEARVSASRPGALQRLQRARGGVAGAHARRVARRGRCRAGALRAPPSGGSSGSPSATGAC